MLRGLMRDAAALWLRPWRHGLDFHGRSRRLEYLLFVATFYGVNFLIGVLFFALDRLSGLPASSDAGTKAAVAFGIMLAVAIVPAIAVSVRRLHDLDLTGSWLFVWLMPFVGPVAGLLLCLVIVFMPGRPGPNRYGADPFDMVEVDDSALLEEVFRQV